MKTLAILGLGLLLGLRHATDPDHVVAIAAITARARGTLAATWLGIAWGIGHTLTLFLTGAAIILFNLAVPPRVGLSLEFAVALALVTVGLLNLKRSRAVTPGDASIAAGRAPTRRAFAVGLVHGLAGSAAVALLVLATIHDPRWACGYLLVFGVGTIAGMAIITTSMAAPLGLAARRWSGLGGRVRLVTGVISLAFGVWLAYQIGWVDGLFLAAPTWTPH